MPAIAKELNCAEDEVMEALRMVAVPMPHEPDVRGTAPRDAYRAAAAIAWLLFVVVVLVAAVATWVH